MDDYIKRKDAINVLTGRAQDIRAFIEKCGMDAEEASKYWCEVHGVYNAIELIESLPSARVIKTKWHNMDGFYSCNNCHSVFTKWVRSALCAERIPDGRATMSDCISRQEAAEIICDWCGVCPKDKRDIMGCDDICPQFAKIPSADVRENVKGKWLCSDDMYEMAVCSICNYDTHEPVDYARANYHFCPNCGADMKGDIDE